MPGTPVANISAMKRFVILLMAVTCVASPGGQPPQKRPCIEPEHIEGIRAYLAQNRPRYMRAIFSARVWLDGLRVDPMEVRAWVVAEHSIFYILERHGELRAIARKLVEKVTRSRLRNDSERAEIAKAHRDQIVFNDGHVISGKIQKFREDTGMYGLRSSAGIDHLAYRAVIRMVVEDGKLTFGAP
ncbi:MAG: hypothetical protein A2341_09535 [Deltaproteobacteria bacterium RIFOXYB12_FULL_58_9]|nr:MAG: hypothetical protein A2341_09535 [Deltaproteobacteria bacterium RIFOXYB12_FULL_58_9]